MPPQEEGLLILDLTHVISGSSEMKQSGRQVKHLLCSSVAIAAVRREKMTLVVVASTDKTQMRSTAVSTEDAE